MGYDEREEKIIEFYLCSLRNDFSGFDWDEALEMFRPELEQKLGEHGLTDLDDFRERQEDIYGDLSNYIGDELTMCSDYIYFTKKDAADAVVQAMYERCQKAFSGLFDEIQEFVEKIDSPPADLSERITLFDSIIHAQHVNGDIFENMDTEDLKAAAKEMFEIENEED